MTGTLKKTFQHEAFFYAGYEEFLTGVAPFVQEGLEADEPTLVLLGADKLALLRGVLGSDADRVIFGDIAEVGHNPARLIPAWFDFIAGYGPDQAIRGVGEPIGPHRRGPALVESSQHEFLLNLAFADNAGLTLMCPYDTSMLGPEVISEARNNHPVLHEDEVFSDSATYRDASARVVAEDLWGPPLPEFAGKAFEMKFDLAQLTALRSLVAYYAREAGLDAERTADLVLSVNELAANSIQYGGGSGELRIWNDGPTLICEVADDGQIADPLVGRRPPGMAPESSRGLWVINQLCDLVQVRSSSGGTIVRLHVHTDGRRRVP